jgi:hypothetical protein
MGTIISGKRKIQLYAVCKTNWGDSRGIIITDWKDQGEDGLGFAHQSAKPN